MKLTEKTCTTETFTSNLFQNVEQETFWNYTNYQIE